MENQALQAAFAVLPNLGFNELLIFGGLAVMLFGKRLPEVARSLGASYRQFREGLADFQKQMDLSSVDTPVSRWDRKRTEVNDQDVPSAPKFEPPVLVGPASDPGGSALPTSEEGVDHEGTCGASLQGRAEAPGSTGESSAPSTLV